MIHLGLSQKLKSSLSSEKKICHLPQVKEKSHMLISTDCESHLIKSNTFIINN